MSDSPERIVEHVKDEHGLGWTYVFVVKGTYCVEFEAHAIIHGGSRPAYEIYGWNCSGDETENLDDACPQISGTIKWDGCSHYWFGNRADKGGAPNGYLHLCGRRCITEHGNVVLHVYDRAQELMKQRQEAQP